MPTPPRVITVTLNPAIDMKMIFQEPRLDALNRASSVQLEPSGKGVNVSRALHAQGILATTIVPLGGPFGLMLEGALRAAQLPFLSVPIAGESRCNVKVIDAITGASTEFNAPGPDLEADEILALRRALIDSIQLGDLVVFSGSLPGNLGSGIYAELIAEVQARGARAILDADRAALREGLAAKPFLVKPNRAEAEELLSIKIDTVDRALEAVRIVQSRGVGHVVLSLGAQGAIFASASETCQVVPPTVRPRSTVGSGDALLSGAIVGLVRGWSWTESARFATALAVARTQLDGVGFPNQAEVRHHLEGVQVIPLQ